MLQAAGVPLVPGTQGSIEELDRVAKQVERESTVDACRASKRPLSFIVDGRSVLAHLARSETGWVLGDQSKAVALARRRFSSTELATARIG